MVDWVLRNAELHMPSLIRALVSGYDRWLGVATRGLDGVEYDGARFEVREGVAWPLRRTDQAVVGDVTDRIVIDVGCGSGYLGLMAALRGARRVLMIDRSPAAVDNTLANAESLGVADRVTARAGHVLSGVSICADVIVSDPPWFREEMGERHRWTTDPEFIPTLLEQAPDRLTDTGTLRLVVPRFVFPDVTRDASAVGLVTTSIQTISRQRARARQLRFLDFLPIVAIQLGRRQNVGSRHEA